MKKSTERTYRAKAIRIQNASPKKLSFNEALKQAKRVEDLA